MQASWGICRPVWRPSRAPWWGGTSLQQQLARAQAAVNKADGQRTRNWNAAAGQSFAGMGRADVVEYAAAMRRAARRPRCCADAAGLRTR